jgi:hypothetical protein
MMLCGAVVLVYATLISAVSAYFLSRPFDNATVELTSGAAGVAAPIGRGDDPTPVIVSGVVLSALVLMACAVQYRTRSRWRSAAALGGGVAAAWLAASYWPIPLLAERLLVPAWAESPGALVVSAREAVASLDENRWSDRMRWRSVVGPLTVSGVERNWQPHLRLAGAALTLDDGMVVESPGSRDTFSPPIDANDEAAQRTVITRLLGVRKLIEATVDVRPTPEKPTVLLVKTQDVARFESRTAAYHGRFVVSLTELAVAGVIPLAQGAKFQDGVFRLVIDDVVRETPTVTARVRMSGAGTLFERRPPATYSFYLRNSRLAEAATGASRITSHAPSLPFLPMFDVSSNSPHGFYARAESIHFPGGVFPGRNDFLAPDWIDGAELVIVRSTPEGSVYRTLDIPRLQIVPLSRSR